MSNFIVYCITNKLDGKQYIGQTTKTTAERFKQHSFRCNKKSYITSSVIKNGKNNFEIKAIYEASSMGELNYFEDYYIKLYNSMSPNGYNLKDGGLNNGVSDLTKEKLRIIFTGLKRSMASKYYGVYSASKVSNRYRSSIQLEGKKQLILCGSNLSEKWCAYKYDEYVLENNLPYRPLNNVSYEEAKADYDKYYYNNGRAKSIESEYYGVYFNRNNKRFYSFITIDKKQVRIGTFNSEIETAKAYNEYIISNGISAKLNTF